MIRMKILHNGQIHAKCKVSPEIAISKYEIGLINSSDIQGLMQIETTGAELLFVCGEHISMSLERWMKQVGKRFDMKKMLLQVCSIVKQAQDAGLDIYKICYHPAYAFVSSVEFQIYFCYFPINGFGYRYDPILFLKDFVQRDEVWKDAWAQKILEIQRIDELLELSRSIQNEKEKNLNTRNGEILTQAEEELLTEAGDEEEGLFDGEEDEELKTESIWEEEAQEETGHFVLSVIRLRTQEAQTVRKTPYIVGRSQQRADFCVTGNPKIGNVHAIIGERGGKYYLEDNDSKNGTFVNDRRLASHEKVNLYDGFKFNLFDETFRVKYKKEGIQ